MFTSIISTTATSNPPSPSRSSAHRDPQPNRLVLPGAQRQLAVRRDGHAADVARLPAEPAQLVGRIADPSPRRAGPAIRPTAFVDIDVPQAEHLVPASAERLLA